MSTSVKFYTAPSGAVFEITEGYGTWQGRHVDCAGPDRQGLGTILLSKPRDGESGTRDHLVHRIHRWDRNLL